MEDPKQLATNLIHQYRETWYLIRKYDEESFEPPIGTVASCALDYSEALQAISLLRDDLKARGEASELFGMERDGGLKAILEKIKQFVVHPDWCLTPHEIAAQLLYAIVKDCPFIDGNKRIGVLLFLSYLAQENITSSIKPNTLTLLTLVIANSQEESKNTLIKLVANVVALSIVNPSES